MSACALDGRVAVVTGSARRIGRAIAFDLARSGAAVVVNGLRDHDATEGTAAEIRSSGGRAIACLADITERDGARRLIAASAAAFGGLDILVNNAALRAPGRLEDLDLDAWRAVLAVTLDGAFLCSQAALPHLKRSGRGRIVNIGGVSGHMGADGRSHVSAAKAGLVGFTKALAVELGPDRITVNCLVPGLIETPDDDAGATAFRRGQTRPDRIPLGRAGTPEEVARAATILCSDDLAYVTGQTIHLNGGIYLA